MKDLRQDLAEIISQFTVEDGFRHSTIPGIRCIKISDTNRRAKNHWRASLSIAAQGCKEIILGREVYRCEGAHYVATPLDLPVTSRIFAATREKPFLCIMIDFDPIVMSEVAAQIEADTSKELENPLRGLFVGKASDVMMEAAIRLAKLLQKPKDAVILGPLIVKEIFYHLLKGENGAAIRQFVMSGSKIHKISKAIYSLQSELTEVVDVEALAKAANMSRSAFFKHFKEITALSPIQYQKRLRLLEARRLMIDEGESAEGSAFRVGYNSASQFSREYSRMFGNSPLRDATKIKKSANPNQQI